MALYIPHSIFPVARLLYVRPETFGPYYVSCWITDILQNDTRSIQYQMTWYSLYFYTLFKITRLTGVLVSFLNILLSFVFYSWLMYSLPNDDLWNIKICSTWSFLIIKLHTDMVHLVDYNNAVYFSLLFCYCLIQLLSAVLLHPSCIPEKKWGINRKDVNHRWYVHHTYLLTYLLTYSLHGAESFLRS